MTSWRHFGNNNVSFVSEKNVCEHAIIIAQCKEYVFLEAVAIEDAWDRVFLFIQYLYADETRPETRKRSKKWVHLCEAKVGEPSRISSILGSPLL